MAKDNRPTRLAVLIDAENIPAKIAANLFREIASIGETSVRRIYGDFANDAIKGWAEVLSHYSILPQQQVANTVGKNAADIALVIDAMDLLHSGRVDGFCLVSSDSDFTRLAQRIREQGLAVYGFGEKKTREGFRQACRHFIDLDNLSSAAAKSLPAPKPVSKQTPEQALELKARASLPTIQAAFEKGVGDRGWLPLNELGLLIKQVEPSFSTKGFGGLSGLLRRTKAFLIEPSDGPAMRVRLKQGAPPPIAKTSD